MRLALSRRPAAVLAAIGAAVATTAAVQLAGTGTASACDTPRPSTVPISSDAPYDSPASNQGASALRAVAPGHLQDYGHLPRWKRYADGRVLLREDRVTLRDNSRWNPEYAFGYTNVNPRIRSYWLDPNATIRLRGYGRYSQVGSGSPTSNGLYRVGRQQFLDAFDVHGDRFAHYLKYRAVYELTFDSTRTRILAIDEVPQFYTC